MKQHRHIRILHLEDLESDAVLVERTLRSSGLSFEIKCVDNLRDFAEALISFSPAVVLSDHHLPGFTSMEALRIVKGANIRIPFILITATVSEEFAVDMMKEGVDDYILKDRIRRLPKAIENALCKVDAENGRQRYLNEVVRAGKRSEALIQNISDAILVINRLGIVTYASPSVKHITGFDFKEMEGRPLPDFLHPGDAVPVIDFVNSISSKRAPMPEHAFRVVHRDGGYIWVEGAIRNFEYDGSDRSFIVNYRDITKRREAALRLEESEANLLTVLDNTEVSYVLTDRDLNIISFNHIAIQSYSEAMGVQLKEGLNLKNLTQEGMKRETLEKFSRALDGETMSYETSFANSDPAVWYEVKILPIRGQNKEVQGLLVASENITGRKVHEMERDQMTADILRHNKDLEQFSYIVSHNLRSPVANIIGLATLINNHDALSPGDYRKCVTGLMEAAKQLDNVIIDLDYILQMRREINEKKDVVFFSPLLEDTRTSISRLLEKENVQLSGEFEAESLFTIKSYLQSIFLNLIVNSIKYRNPAVDTVIRVRSRKAGDKIILSFKDNGLGIDMDAHRDKIFGLYKKFHLHKEGKGMGLYMVKTQVEMLGGTISVNSRVNEGTEFVLEFDA